MRKITAGVGVLISSILVGSGFYFDWFNGAEKKEQVTEVESINEAMHLIEEQSVYSTKKGCISRRGSSRHGGCDKRPL